MNIIIRDEQNEDIEAIENLTKAAFHNAEHTSHTEHFIVNSLRNHGQLTISLVAVEDGSIIGHVAISPVQISSGEIGWYGLGPISVHPDKQGLGIGSLLMNKSLEKLKAGDKVRVVGEVDTHRVKPTDIEVFKIERVK